MPTCSCVFAGPVGAGPSSDDHSATMYNILSDFLAGNLPGESQVQQPLPDLPHSPLGLNVSAKLKSRIVTDQYVELSELLPLSRPNHAQPEVSISLSGSTASVSSTRVAKALVLVDILNEQWTDAWLVFASVYLERHPAEAVGILRYAETIRDMPRHGPYLAWRQYDEQFRQAKAVHPLPGELLWATCI